MVAAATAPSCRLVAPAGFCIASRRPLVAPPSRQLIAPACCRIASSCPLVAPRAALSSSHCAGWLLRHLSTRRPIIVSSSCRAASRCLVASAGCRAIISCRHLVAPPSCPLIVLAGCCVACPCAALSSSRRSPSPTPSNAIERCCRHRTPPPPPPLNAVSIVHRCHSCPPSSPPSKANAHLRPSPLSNADARCHHPPLLMSISIVASSLLIRSPPPPPLSWSRHYRR